MKIESHQIMPHELFPNNPSLPLLHYRNVFKTFDIEEIKRRFAENGWKNSWVNGIYGFHHFHSNTHEVLGIASGTCDVQFGGPDGPIVSIQAGDMVIIPAGVAHRNIGSSHDFICVGSYPTDIPYDMHEGIENTHQELAKKISEVPLPSQDPLLGAEGPLLEHWQ